MFQRLMLGLMEIKARGMIAELLTGTGDQLLKENEHLFGVAAVAKGRCRRRTR